MFNTLRNKNKLNLAKPLDRFSYIKPQMKLICDFKSHLSQELQLNTLSISEMYYYEDLLVILSEDGMIYIVDILCTSNQQNQLGISQVRSIPFYSMPQKLAKSISLNIFNGSLLIVYLLRDGNLAELKCARVTLLSLKQYMNGTIELSQINPEIIFHTENLSSPAFVEFDEFNSKIITRNSLATYKVWSMKDFNLIFEMTDKRIEEIRTADGIFLTIRSVETIGRLLLSIYEIETGKLVINYEINLVHQVELEILEIFDKVLLLKQAGSSAIIINLINFEHHFIKNDNLDDKSLFMYINKADVFVTLNKNTLIFYSIKGEELRSIKNDNIETISPNFVHLTGDKNYLLVYWEKRSENVADANNIGNTQINYFTNNTLRTPKSKNITGKSSKVLLTENSNFSRGENFPLTSVIKNGNTSMSRMINSSISEISNANDVSEKWESDSCFSSLATKFVAKQKEIFKGEFELINLKETVQESKLFINSDNMTVNNYSGNINDCNLKESFSFNYDNDSEDVNYFIFNTKTMRVYIIMQSGKLYECAI